MISAGEENPADVTTMHLRSSMSVVLLVLSSSPPVHCLSYSFRIQQILIVGPGYVVVTGPMQFPQEAYRLVGEVASKHILPQMGFCHCDKGMKVQYRVP